MASKPPQNLFSSLPPTSQPKPATPSTTTTTRDTRHTTGKPEVHSPKADMKKHTSHTGHNVKQEPVVTMSELFAKFKLEGNDLVKKVIY